MHQAGSIGVKIAFSVLLLLELKDKSLEIQALSLVEKTITKINFWYGLFWQDKTINVWAYISKDFIVNFNILAPNSAKIID